MITWKKTKNAGKWSGAVELHWRGRPMDIAVYRCCGLWHAAGNISSYYPNLFAARNTRGAAVGVAIRKLGQPKYFW